MGCRILLGKVCRLNFWHHSNRYRLGSKGEIHKVQAGLFAKVHVMQLLCIIETCAILSAVPSPCWLPEKKVQKSQVLQVVNLLQTQSCSGLATQLPTPDMHKMPIEFSNFTKILCSIHYYSISKIVSNLISRTNTIQYTFTSAAPLSRLPPHTRWNI